MLKKCKYLTRATDIVKFFMELKVKPGDVAVDCTCGNGNDTLKLLNLVKEDGKVYGFDIQKLAIENTEKKCSSSEYFSNLELVCDSHANIKNYVNEGIDFAVFNLGYLPKGDHSIITKPESTIEAVKNVIEKLNDGGMLAIAVYTGHEGGEEESECLFNYLKNIDQESCNVVNIDFLNGKNSPPKVIVIEKKQYI